MRYLILLFPILMFGQDSVAVEIDKYMGYDKIADVMLVSAVFMKSENDSKSPLSYSMAITAIVIKFYSKYKLSKIVKEMKTP